MGINKQFIKNAGQYSVLFASFLALLGFAASANTIPPLISTMGKDLGQSLDYFGVVVSIQYLFFAVAAFTGGYFESKLKRGNSALVFLGLVLLSIAFVVATGFKNIFSFIIWAIPFGFAGGLVETFSSVIIANRSKVDSSKLLALSQFFFCIGAYLGPQMVSIFLELGWTWRQIFYVFALLVMIIAGLFYFLTHNKVINLPESKRLAHQNKTDNKTKYYLTLEFWFFAILLFFYVVAELTSICWVPVYFEEKFCLSASSAAFRAALLWFGLIVGRLLILILPKKWTLWPSVFIGSSGMMVTGILIHLTASVMTSTILILVFGIFAGPLWPVIVMLANKTGKNDSFTSSVIGCGALGAAIGPSFGSIIINQISIESMFLPISAICIAMLGILCTIFSFTKLFKKGIISS